MRKIYKWQFEEKLKHFRKIHIAHGIWLVALCSAKTEEGKFPLNMYNIIHFPLTFIFVPIKVIDWGDKRGK